MAGIVGTVKFRRNRRWTHGSSVIKTQINRCNGRSLSFFKRSTDERIIPWFYAF
jgi:hypothetical protein